MNNNHDKKTTTTQKTFFQRLLAVFFLSAIPAWGAFVQLDDTPHRVDGSFFGLILLVIFLWGLFTSKETRKFLIIIPLSYGLPVVMVLAWFLIGITPLDYKPKQWFAAIALGWIGFWIVFFTRGFLRNSEAPQVAASPHPNANPVQASKVTPSPSVTEKRSTDQDSAPVKETTYHDDAFTEKIKPSPNPSAPGAKKPKSASEPQPTTSANRKFDREKALRAISDSDARGQSVSELDRTPEAKPDAGQKPFSYTAGSYTRTAKEANTTRLHVEEITFTTSTEDTQEFQPTSEDIRRLEENIFNCKPDVMLKVAPCEDSIRIDITATVNGEYLRIRVCLVGMFHENIYGWVHRALKEDDFCYWEDRLWQLDGQFGNQV